MARSSRPAQPSVPSEPRLTVPVPAAAAKIEERIAVAESISAQIAAVQSLSDIDECRRKVWTWHEYNVTLLRRLLGPAADDVYHQRISFGGASSPNARLAEINEDLKAYVRQLESVRDRLALWEVETAEGARPSAFDADGPVFVVHGSQLLRAQEVARVIEKMTGRDAVILHEEPNNGLTVIEKFERHAESAAFAVVLLTADDEGRAAGSEDGLRPRGRQNVVLEMGYFFGKLGRAQVSVLYDPGVEQPSDIHGLVYVKLDQEGAWKQKLGHELSRAGIAVNFSAIQL